MKLSRLIFLVLILVVPIFGMAQVSVDTNYDENEDYTNKADTTIIYVDSTSSNIILIEHERDNDSYIYIDSLHPGEEYIYVTEYEEEKNWVDRVITRLLKTSVDTNYITTNDYGLQVKVDFNTFNSQSNFRWSPIADTLPNYCTISSEQISKIGIWVGYRNFGLGGSLDLKSFGKSTQQNIDLSFSYYGDAWGIELGANQTRGNNLNFNNSHTDISSSSISNFRIYINSYYAPLYRKFSYNAAFSHSMRQEKSAGSPLFGLSALTYYLHSPKTEWSHIVSCEKLTFPTEITYISINLNAGYAHNFVTKKKTLLHVSALPYITLYKESEVNPKPNIYSDHDPYFHWGAVARASWIWQREHHLISLFGSINYNNIINSPIKLSDTVIRAGTCYGFRAYKHHKPRMRKRILKRKNRRSNSQVADLYEY